MATDSAALSSLKAKTSADNTAEALTARQVCRFASIALCLYPLLLTDPIRSMAQVMPAWWTPVALILLIAPSAAMFAASWCADEWWLRRSAVAAAAAYAAILISFPLFWDGAVTSDGVGAWIAPLAGVASVTAAVAMPIPAAVCYLLGAVFWTRLVSGTIADRMGIDEYVAESAWALLVAAVPFVIGLLALRAGKLLDVVRARTTSGAAQVAAEESRQRERVRFDALTHDGVLSIMLVASRSGVSPDLEHQAAAALDQLDALNLDDGVQRHLSLNEMRVEFETWAALTDAELAIEGPIIAPGSSATYPLEVVRAMTSAMAEALQNSLRHSGSEATRRVTLTIGSDTLTVAVSDDGVGFDQTQVPSNRLGIALSIYGRMTNVRGGSARILSEPGAGTLVLLSWRRPS